MHHRRPRTLGKEGIGKKKSADLLGKRLVKGSMVVCRPKKNCTKYLFGSQPCPQERSSWVPVWAEQLDEFDSSGKWNQRHKNQYHLLVGKIPKMGDHVRRVMQELARKHYKYRANTEGVGMLATLCYLRIYANSQSNELMFEFKICPNMTPPLGTVIRDRDSWTQYDDKWRTFCFMLRPEHTDYKKACIFVTNNTNVDLQHACFNRCFDIFIKGESKGVAEGR